MEMNGTTVIGRPVDTVFAYVSNVSNDAHWRTGVTESGWRSGESPEPGTIGYTRAGETEVEWRIVAYSPGESIDWELISGPIRGRGGYRLVPVEQGTQFTLVADVKPSGWYRLLGPLFGWVGRRQNQADVEKLRDILEST
jgi:uncharacterized membrane protein